VTEMSTDNTSVSKLKAMLRRKMLTGDELTRHVAELRGTNDRLVAVVGGSMIDGALEGKLQKLMIPLDSKSKYNAVFGHPGPLSSFSSKIVLAHALGLIDNNIRRNADYIREIRNAFAHSIKPIRFATPEVAAVCRLLVFRAQTEAKLKRAGLRRRFLLAVVDTGQAIWGRGTLAK